MSAQIRTNNSTSHLVLLLCNLLRIRRAGILVLVLHHQRGDEREQSVDLLGRADHTLRFGDAVNDAERHLLPVGQGQERQETAVGRVKELRYCLRVLNEGGGPGVVCEFEDGEGVGPGCEGNLQEVYDSLSGVS